MTDLTPEGLRIVTDAANRHGFSLEAAANLLDALAQGNGYQAQFNHPDFGGMGQWSQGGMIMIGDMFNQGLKHRVDALCGELAALLRSQSSFARDVGGIQSPRQASGVSLFAAGSTAAGQWWPEDLGSPASVGAQNDLRYAFFPGSRRLAIQQGGGVQIYDAGEHRLSGFSQQQGSDQSLTFTSQFGLVRVADLPLVTPAHRSAEAQSPSAAVRSSPPSVAPSPPATAAAPFAAPVLSTTADDILKTIERLAELREKGIVSEEEFAAKKAELLSRL
jgi:Short C-terminal domain